MEFLEREIKLKGKVLPGNVLKVGSFLNHQIDVNLMTRIGKEIYTHFKDKGVTKVLTVEASGIAFALAAAQNFGCNMVFAKKSASANADGEVYSAECYSYTRQKSNMLILPKEYLTASDNVLIIDDFLAHGNATNALREIVDQAGANLVGVAIGIEKGFQGGGDEMRKNGIDLLSLAIVDKMENGEIVFRK
jgi:xanthine phosphoribosyltransferase